MRSFKLESFVGPKPLKFGLSSAEVSAILGAPASTRKRPGGGVKALHKFGERSSILAFYDKQDRLAETTFDPGSELELWFHGHDLLREPDLLGFLTGLDSKPTVTVGIAVFLDLGISMDAEPPTARSGRTTVNTVTCFVQGTFDHLKALK